MGNSAFTAKLNGVNWVDQVFTTPIGIQPGEQYDLAVSDLITNQASQRGAKVVVRFTSVTPDIPGSPFSLGVVVEGKDDQGNFFPLGYSFTKINYSKAHAFKRIIEIDPNLDTFNLGIDDVQYVSGSEISRISRNRAFVPDEGFRIRLILSDYDPSGPNAFQQCVCTVTGEQYNA